MKIEEIGNNWNLYSKDSINGNNKEFKKAILGISNYIPLGAIVPEKTSFVSTGKNVFNKDSTFYGRVGINGNLVESDTIVTAVHSSISKNSTYYTNQSIWINLHDDKLEFVSYLYVAKGDNFSTSSDTAFIRISVNEILKDSLQVQKGSRATPYEPYGLEFKDVTVKELSLARKSELKNTSFANIGHRISAIESDVASYVPSNPVSAEVAEQVFIAEMNKKAVALNFTRPNFKNSSGLSQAGQVTVTKDMTLLLRAAMNTPALLNIWGRKSYTAEVKGVNPRSVTVDTTVKNSTFEQEYTILGGKTGTLGIVHNLSVVARHKSSGKIVAGNVLRSNTDRWVSMKVALDNAVNGASTAVDAYAASSFVVENNSALTLFESIQLSYLHGEISLQSPASLTKILTAITAIEKQPDLNMQIVFIESDLVEDVLPFQTGDMITLHDALHLMILQSNNSTAKAVGRTVGQHIIKTRGFA